MSYVEHKKEKMNGLITKVFLLCRLCVAALSVNNFRDNREALYGVFDGDRNVEVPYLLQCTMSDILAEELQKTKNEEEYMVNTFIVMQR
jgi:PH domain/leucine-rich repeat-containing protein phosphatase